MLLRRALISREYLSLSINTCANVFGLAFPAAAALVAIPILVRELGLQQFGYFSVQLGIIYFLGVADLGISRTIVLSASAESPTGASTRPYRVGMYYTRILAAVVA